MAITQLDASSIEIDDNHPFVFSGGSWSEETHTGLGLFDDTVSFTREAGSTKVVRFVGTSITVYGGVQQYDGTPNSPLAVQGSVDGGPASTFSPPSPQNGQYIVAVYYQSPVLTMGEHVLTLRNTVNNDIVHVDAFVIRASGGGKPQVLQSDGSQLPPPVQAPNVNPAPNLPSPSSTPANPAQTPVVMSTTVTADATLTTFVTLRTPMSGVAVSNMDQQSRGPGSTNSTSASTPLSTSLATASTTSSSATIVTIPTQPDSRSGQSSQPSHSKTTAIIASLVCASVLAIILILILFFLRLKRRKNRIQDVVHPFTKPEPIAPIPQVNIEHLAVARRPLPPKIESWYHSTEDGETVSTSDSGRLMEGQRWLPPLTDMPLKEDGTFLIMHSSQLPPYEP